MIRFHFTMFELSSVFCALIICGGCAETSAPKVQQADTEEQKQLKDLADEVTRLRQQVADKDAADAAAIREFERVIVNRPAPPMPVQPTEAERKRASVLSAIEELPIDDRETATRIYEKIETDILSLDVIEANFASCGNGSRALSHLFAERLFSIYKQGVPKEDLIEWNRFGYQRNQENWHFPIILSAATTLKLEDEFELLSLCRRCFLNGGTGLTRLEYEVGLLTKKDPKSRDHVMIDLLDGLKREPLFKYILDDYLRWAIPLDVEKAVATAKEEKTAFAFNERVGSFESVERTEKELQELADLSVSTRERLRAQNDFVLYSQVAINMRRLVTAINTAKDRKEALKEHCSLFEIVVDRVRSSNEQNSPNARRTEAISALADFDAGLRIIFPNVNSEELLTTLLREAGNGELPAKLDVTAGLFSANMIRGSLVAAALEARNADLHKQGGEFVPVDRSKGDAKTIAETWVRLQAKMTSNLDEKPNYSTVADDVKALVAGCRSAKDRSTALSELCRYFRLVVRIVHGLDGRVSDADSVRNATEALNDFDQGVRIAFPGIGPNDQVAFFLIDASNAAQNLKIGRPVEDVKRLFELREKLIAAASQRQE